MTTFKGKIKSSHQTAEHMQPDNTPTDDTPDKKVKMRSFFYFMEETVVRMRQLGRIRCSETYATAMNSFRRFLQSQELGECGSKTDIIIDRIDSDTMVAYEAWLKNSSVSLNTSSFYMRNLRSVYNRAVEKGLTPQRFPFRHVYTGIEKTAKRAVPMRVIRNIINMDLSESAALEFAKDMFLFSFYTRGMSFVDMAYLRKRDLNSGILTYLRRKTGQQLFIQWEDCMQKIVDKYDSADSEYLLPIIKSTTDKEARRQYLYMSHNVNRGVKIIGKRLGLPIPLTMYVARHAWASIARSKNIPLSVISESMGHDSESTTRIYLASLDNVAVNNANSLILKALHKTEKK